MEIRDLINQLEEIAQEYGDETPVLAAFQPNYPLQFSVSRPKMIDVNDRSELDDPTIVEDVERFVCYLPCWGHPDAEGFGPYAPDAVFRGGY